MTETLYRLLVVIAIMASALAGNAADDVGYTIGIQYVITGYMSTQRFSHASGLFFDAHREELYVADTGNHQIVVFDKKGMPTARFTHTVQVVDADAQSAGEPRSLVVKKNGDLLVTDNLCSYIDVLDFQGHSVQKVWLSEVLGKPGDDIQPRCLALDAQENLYVSVSGDLNAILVLTPGFAVKQIIDCAPYEEKGTKAITGLWVDGPGRIYATFAQGDCVSIFAPDGKPVCSFGQHDSGPQNFSLPSGITTDSAGNLWVVDNLRHVVTVFKTGKDGKPEYLDMIGGFGQQAGQFSYPSAITGDGATRLFVMENTGARVQAFILHFTTGAGNK